MKSRICFNLVFLVSLLLLNAHGRGVQEYVKNTHDTGDMKLAWQDSVADVHVGGNEDAAVLHCANYFAQDVHRVAGKTPALKQAVEGLSTHAVIVGTLGRSEVIQGLAEAGKIDVSGIEGKWEAFLVQVVSNPLPGVETALVCGSTTSGRACMTGRSRCPTRPSTSSRRTRWRPIGMPLRWGHRISNPCCETTCRARNGMRNSSAASTSMTR